jgi:aminobenzoyl-glutamate utilization protein B
VDGSTSAASIEKAFCFDYLERNAGAIATLNDSIFYFGELGMQETETSGLMCELLEAAGFKVERGISGFASGFCATCGSGSPVIAIHSEYDANPDNSQASGVAEQRPIVEGAPGHCEGHNANAAVLVASALAAKAAIDHFGLKGTLKVFGAPAEEQLISRPYYVRDGWFDDVDVAFADHIGTGHSVGYGLIQSALISATFTFHGEAAHAAVVPWKGRDALDAVVLMDMGLAQYREHMIPTMRAQRVITNGGNQPNVVPRTATMWWMFRDSAADGVLKLFEQAKKIAEGAALMTNTSVETGVISAVWPVRGNRTLAELFQREIERLGPRIGPRRKMDSPALCRRRQKCRCKD